MKRDEIGSYETTRIAGESVRAVMPHPSPPDPPIVLDASLQQALESAEAAIANLNQAFETSGRPAISLRPPSPPRSYSLPQIEGIHPFFDGNGRSGRSLIVWQLCPDKIIRSPLLPLSTYFNQHQSTYSSLISHVHQTGDWEAWLRSRLVSTFAAVLSSGSSEGHQN